MMLLLYPSSLATLKIIQTVILYYAKFVAGYFLKKNLLINSKTFYSMKLSNNDSANTAVITVKLLKN